MKALCELCLSNKGIFIKRKVVAKLSHVFYADIVRGIWNEYTWAQIKLFDDLILKTIFQRNGNTNSFKKFYSCFRQHKDNENFLRSSSHEIKLIWYTYLCIQVGCSLHTFSDVVYCFQELDPSRLTWTDLWNITDVYTNWRCKMKVVCSTC